MNTNARKWLSILLALTLLVTCTVSGVVLPVSANETNLLINGDLEADASQGWGGSAYVQDGVGVDGSRGIKIETTVNEGDAAVWPGPYYKGAFNAILEENTTYVFSFDYKHEGKGFGKFDITRPGTDWTGWVDINLPAAEGWTTQTIEFTTGSAANMDANTGWEWAPAHVHYANAANYGTGVVYYDNFSLVKKSDAPEPSGELTMPNGDFSVTDTGWTDASKNAVTVLKDSADGNGYIQVPADGAVITSPKAVGDVKAGDWVRASFRVRKTAAGKARIAMRWQGNVVSGYAQPDWILSTTEDGTRSDGEWITFTAYAQAKFDTSAMYLQFQTVNSTVSLDLDDVTVENIGTITEGELNLLPGGTMDVPSFELNGHGYEGLFYDGGELVADLDDAANKVLKLTADAQAYLRPSVRTIEAADSTAKTNIFYNKNTVYKLTYRQKGTGTTNPTTTSAHATVISVEGEPMVASDTWKTVTMYFCTTSNTNATYTLDFKTYGEVYLDDMALYEMKRATAITLDKTALELEIGDTATLTATTTPADAYAPSTVWSSSAERVATVDETGKITALAAGVTTITATCGDLTATCEVTVGNPKPATGVEISTASLTLQVGITTTLTAATTPEGSYAEPIVWSTSDASVVTVDNGKLTAVAVGTATITAKSGMLTASCAVTVKEADGNMIVNGDLEMGVAGTFDHLPAEGCLVQDGVGVDGSKALVLSKDFEHAVTYFKNMGKVKLEPNSRYVLSLWSKGPSVLVDYSTVTDLFFVGGEKGWRTVANTDEWNEIKIVFDTGAAPDLNNNWSFFIKQTKKDVDADTYIDNITLTKQPDAESITIVPSSIDLLPDDAVTLTIGSTPLNSNVGIVTWTSSDENIVAVSQDGVITALADEGTVAITATNDKGLSATCKVTINEYGNLLKNGDFEQQSANWGPDAKNAIKPGIGKDGSYGLELTNPTEGKDESVFYKLALSVLPATTYEISFDYLATPGAEFRVWSGTMKLVSPKVEKGDGTEWKRASGTFTTPANLALNKGWDISIVSDVEGETPAVIDNVCLRLYNSGVKAESVVLNKSKITLVPGRSETLAIMATPVNGDTNRATWISSNEDVATVEYGVITAVGKGTATIIATTRNGKAATCEVMVSGDEALIKNGTFDNDNDKSWTLSGGAVLEDGKGRAGSAAAVLVNGASVSQSTDRLQANATYQLSFRYRSTAGNVTAKLTNGDVVLLEKTTEIVNNWTQMTYEFTVPETLAEKNSVLTLTTTGAGPIYVDNVMLAQKASLIDFVVSDIVWLGGEDQVITGTELTFATTVANQGIDPVPVGSVIEVDIAINGEVIRTLTYTCTEVLNAGSMAIIMDTQPWVSTEGAHVVSARANPRLTVLEAESTNNTRQVHLRVADEALPVPEVAQQAGMDRLIFSDEFDTINSIDTLATGLEGYKWYVTRQWSAGTVTRDAYDVENGILTLKNPANTYGITLTTVDVNTQIGFSWNKGYLEVRLCIPSPKDTYGGAPTVWSFPTSKWYETPGENTHWVEMDWLEFWGNIDAHPEGYWTIALHDQTKPEGANDSTEWYRNSNSTVDALGDRQWHTIGWLWDENLIQAYLDGEQVFELTYGEDTVPIPLPSVQKGELKDGIFSAMNEQIMCLFLGGSDEIPMQVDYVRIWQGVGGGIAPDTGDDEELEIQIDMTAEEFWYNYCTDDWGENITEITEENYLNVLGGEDIWPLLGAERQEEINALLVSNGQPTYEELLAAAKAMQEAIDSGAAGDEDLGDEEEPAPDTDRPPADTDPTPDAEQEPDTGVTSVLPTVLTVVMLLSAAFLSALRKRRMEG